MYCRYRKRDSGTRTRMNLPSLRRRFGGPRKKGLQVPPGTALVAVDVNCNRIIRDPPAKTRIFHGSRSIRLITASWDRIRGQAPLIVRPLYTGKYAFFFSECRWYW